LKCESVASRAVKRKPILLGYIAGVVTITLMWQIAEWAGWVH